MLSSCDVFTAAGGKIVIALNGVASNRKISAIEIIDAPRRGDDEAEAPETEPSRGKFRRHRAGVYC